MEKLLEWYKKHGRDLPWRKTTAPYKILVSEIMLQQTQVDRVKPKYEQWLRLFPNWKALAAASKTDVLKAWSGLGYNNRAIRLQLLAQVLGGKELPKEEEELKKLPGIGPYTAGAVRAFAFDKPGHFVDVNVERVLKRYRYTKLQRPTREQIVTYLFDLQEDHSPRQLGNALMDLGSKYCVAANPKCDDCPLFDECKSKGERPEEKNLREKKRQSTFLHSNRWWRGQILKQLTNKPLNEEELYSGIDGDAKKDFSQALNQLRKEGLVVGNKKLQIKE